jgi:hypothetical protein
MAIFQNDSHLQTASWLGAMSLMENLVRLDICRVTTNADQTIEEPFCCAWIRLARGGDFLGRLVTLAQCLKHAQRSPLTRSRLEAHLTTFVEGYINVDLAADTIQEPMIRFTNDGMAPMIIRFIVGAFHIFELHRARRFISTQRVSGPM